MTVHIYKYLQKSCHCRKVEIGTSKLLSMILLWKANNTYTIKMKQKAVSLENLSEKKPIYVLYYR